MEKIKVVGLMTVLTLMLVGLGGYIGGNGGALLFFIIALAMNFGMYWFSDKIVLKQYRAHVIEPGEEGGRFDELYNMVDRLRRNANMPMPVVAISEQPQPNAFATGRNPSNAVVCVTRGMWELVARGQMTVDELEDRRVVRVRVVGMQNRKLKRAFILRQHRQRQREQQCDQRQQTLHRLVSKIGGTRDRQTTRSSHKAESTMMLVPNSPSSPGLCSPLARERGGALASGVRGYKRPSPLIVCLE